MGSLFYINVPTRAKEVILRQRELSFLAMKEADQGSKEEIRRISVDSKTDGGSSVAIVDPPSTSGSQIELHPSAGKKDVYKAEVEGKTANVVVTHDSMTIYNIENDSGSGPKLKPRKHSINETFAETIIQNTFLEKHLEDCLKKFKIYDATWGMSIDESFSQISFTVQDSRSEIIINHMVSLGIGTKYDSTLSVCSAVVYYNPYKHISNPEEGQGGGSDSFGKSFLSSIKSRLTVAQVVQTVQANAIMTFDYMMLIIIAATIAGLGLVDNSPVSVVASMLISPLMGPIMAGCFGTVVRDKKLIKTGVISELVGLFLCLLVGFSLGVSVQWAPFPGPWTSITDWPTNEMLGRGRLRGVAVGALIAIPSGAGVALSILGGNAGSLVGVAISASLLPPAVNCGIFWGMAAVISAQESAAGNHPFSIGCYEQLVNHVEYRIRRADFVRSDYTCDNIIREYAIRGIVSFFLTIANIVLILLSGYAVLKIKEVAPHTTRKAMSRFWKEDLKSMREYNKTHGSWNKQEFIEEIGGSNTAQELRERLANDAVFNQVARRNVFGNNSNVLDMSVHSVEEPELETDTSGWFSKFTGLFSSKRKPVNESELNTPNLSGAVNALSSGRVYRDI